MDSVWLRGGAERLRTLSSYLARHRSLDTRSCHASQRLAVCAFQAGQPLPPVIDPCVLPCRRHTSWAIAWRASSCQKHLNIYSSCLTMTILCTKVRKHPRLLISPCCPWGDSPLPADPSALEYRQLYLQHRGPLLPCARNVSRLEATEHNALTPGAQTQQLPPAPLRGAHLR